MRGSLLIARVGGIGIYVHFTWLIVFALATFSLAVGFFPLWAPEWSPVEYWGLGALTALLAFGSVLAHELSHSFIAIRRGMPVKSVTLFIFGGVTHIRDEPRNPGDELVTALAGPASSLVLAAFFGLLWLGLRHIHSQLSILTLYLAIINASLAVFNMFPGFPLDGGRILHALLWAATDNPHVAARVAIFAGQGLGYLLVITGAITTLRGTFFSGLWLLVIGLFLVNAAGSSSRQMTTREMLRGLKVRDLMSRDYLAVEPWVPISTLVKDYMLQHSERAFPVLRDSQLLGMITIGNVRAVPRSRWATTTVGEAMTRRDKLVLIGPEDDASSVVYTLDDRDTSQLAVVEGESLVGLLRRSQVIRFLQVRRELGVRSPP